MRVFYAFFILLFSCGEKKSQQVDNQSPRPVDDLVGKWRKQASCDGSIMCNQCPEVFFKADGFVVFQGGPFGQTKWKVTETSLKITHIYGDPLIDGGEYSISFKDDEVELIDNKNGDCSLLYRIL